MLFERLIVLSVYPPPPSKKTPWSMNFLHPRALCAKFGQIFPDIYQSICDKKRSIELSGLVNINRKCLKQLRIWRKHAPSIDWLFGVLRRISSISVIKCRPCIIERRYEVHGITWHILTRTSTWIRLRNYYIISIFCNDRILSILIDFILFLSLSRTFYLYRDVTFASEGLRKLDPLGAYGLWFKIYILPSPLWQGPRFYGFIRRTDPLSSRMRQRRGTRPIITRVSTGLRHRIILEWFTGILLQQHQSTYSRQGESRFLGKYKASLFNSPYTLDGLFLNSSKK